MQDLLNAVIQLFLSHDDRLEVDDWFINLVARGTNSFVYRVRHTGDPQTYSDPKDLAVKIVHDDARQRALREFETLEALQNAGCSIQPEPLYLANRLDELDGASLLVSSWLPGRRLETPPDPPDKRGWRDILYAYSIVHRLSPNQVRQPLSDAIMPIYHPRDLFALLQTRRAELPDMVLGGLSSAQLDDLLAMVDDRVQRQWQQPVEAGLIHCDPDPGNMLTHDCTIRLVDWEYSGWADPAFEIGDLCAQPMYFDLPDAHRAWIRAEYGRIMEDSTAFMRAAVYETMMNVFWVLSLSQQIAHAADRPYDDFDRSGSDYLAMMQIRYWKRAQQMLGTLP